MIRSSTIALVLALLVAVMCLQQPTSAIGEQPPNIEKCPNGKVWTNCGGCQKTCANPSPICHRMCVKGCFCPPDKVELPSGECVKPSECPKQEKCKGIMKFNECASACTKTCDSKPNEPCTKQCVAKCECPPHAPILLDENTGHCGTLDRCPKRCDKPKEWQDCGSACPLTCKTLGAKVACPAICVKGCFCPPHSPVLLPSGDCGKAEDCKQRPPPIKCPGRMEYSDCAMPGSCAKTCKDPTVICKGLRCEPGCACPAKFPILLDEKKGWCGTRDDCKKLPPPIKCPGRMEYSECAMTGACAKTCKNPNVVCNTLRCQPGCVCPANLPILLDEKTGRCGHLGECKLPPPIKCPGKMEYSECAMTGACAKTCKNPNVVCNTLRCQPGCVCPAKSPILIDEKTGTCGTMENCKKLPPPIKCPGNFAYRDCANAMTGGCAATCDKPGFACRPAQCIPGCACPDGLPILLDAKRSICGEEKDCHRPGKDKCPKHLEWKNCGSRCTATCGNPTPKCTKECVQKCECPANKPILLKNNKCGTVQTCEHKCVKIKTKKLCKKNASEHSCAWHPATKTCRWMPTLQRAAVLEAP